MSDIALSNQKDLNRLIKSIELNDGQAQAVELFYRWYDTRKDFKTFQSAILKGKPGSGKSFLIMRFILGLCGSSGKKLNIFFTAPTNEAKDNLQSLVEDLGLWRFCNIRYFTTQSIAGMRVAGVSNTGYLDESWQCRDLRADLMIVDEYSMIDKKVYGNLSRVIELIPTLFVGDLNQLSAINPKDHENLEGVLVSKGDSIVDIENPDYIASLNETVRFSGSILQYVEEIEDLYSYPKSRPLLPSARLLDNSLRVVDAAEFVNNELKDVVSSEQFRDDFGYAKILTYTNAGVQKWNKAVRRLLYEDTDVLHEGEQLIVKTPVYGIVETEIKCLFYTNQKFKPDYIIPHSEVSDYCPELGQLDFQMVYAKTAYKTMESFLFPFKRTIDTLTPFLLSRFNSIVQRQKASDPHDSEVQREFKLEFNDWNNALKLFGLAYKFDPKAKSPIKRVVIPYYAATIHCLQGRTIKHVILDWHDLTSCRAIDEQKRLVYVAASRASKTLTILI